VKKKNDYENDFNRYPTGIDGPLGAMSAFGRTVLLSLESYEIK